MGKDKAPAASVPAWMGAWPFARGEEKRPIVITRDRELSTLYGFEGRQVCSEIFVSTDIFCFNEWTLPPGHWYEPAGLHPADEVYYVTEGSPIAFNAELGEVFQLHQGDALLIPTGTRHQIANFTAKVVKIIATNAPVTWVEEAGGTRIPPVTNPAFFTRGGKG
jgi:mannose-6-phosphate isomerase-like protein (cupin superfamily)